MTPDPSTPGPSPTAGGTPRNQRYVFLVARLRNRQMTMEEATELFALMDGMLQASEAARLALSRAPTAVPASAPAMMPPPSMTLAPRPAASGGGDDFLLMGLLAMGAGAGLLAAMGRRMQDLGSPASAPPSAKTGTSATKSP